MKQIRIGTKIITNKHRPFIVAELSGNHQQDFDLAIKMIEVAAKAGVDAIKLQTYTADSMTLDIDKDEFLIKEEGSLWQGENLYSLYQRANTPWEWHKALFEKANSLGLIAFSSPFDAASVDFLETLNVPCYKIASFENNDLPLIKKVAKTGKPLIISCGMASIIEIELAVKTAYESGNKQLILLKCTSDYPADASDSHLNTILDMQQRFDCLVGLSDHCNGISTSLASIALGACMIEKHFVLDKSKGGVDAQFSLEPTEIRSLVKESQRVYNALGTVTYGGSQSEQKSKRYRRSIYASENIAKGETFSVHNLRVIRPGLGLEPKHIDRLLNGKASMDIARGSAISWDMFDDMVN